MAYVAARPQTVEGRAGAQEHPAASRFRSPAFKIDRDCLSDLMRQGQRPFLTALAMHAQTAFAPVDIAQLEPDDLSCPQPEPRKQQQDGAIAQPGRRSPLSARVQKSPNAVGWHRSRDRCHRPAGNGWHCRRKVGMNVVAIAREAEERAQCRDDVLRRSECAVRRRFAPDIVHDLAGLHSGEAQLILAGYVRQKAPYVPGVNLDGRRRQAAIFAQVRPVFLQDPLDSGRLDRRRSPAVDDAFFLKPARYAGQGDAVAALRRRRRARWRRNASSCAVAISPTETPFRPSHRLNSLMRNVFFQ